MYDMPIRDNMFLGQTPQAFDYKVLLKLQKKTFHCWDDNKRKRDSLKKNFLKLNFKQISNIIENNQYAA